MLRRIFNNKNWSKLKAILLDHGVYDKPDLRQTVEGMFYRIRVGCLWRDLPETFGLGTKYINAFARGPDTQAIGKSHGGTTTKIHMSVDSFGLPSHFIITGGEVADCSAAPKLIVHASQADAVVGDKLDRLRVEGAGNVVGSRSCDTRKRKGEPTGNTNIDLPRRASPRPYL